MHPRWPQDLPITPDLNVAKVLDICTHFLELTDPRMDSFGIFVEDVEDPSAPATPDAEGATPHAGLPKTPRPLQNDEFISDVVASKSRQNQPIKFVIKCKIFLKNVVAPSTTDQMFERLIYLQVRRAEGAGGLWAATATHAAWSAVRQRELAHPPPHPHRRWTI